MKIGIVGAGSMGVTLGCRLSRLGHRVSIANSRGPESLSALAAEIGATPATVNVAVNVGEVVVIAIPTKAVADLPRPLFSNLQRNTVVIDIGNYHPELRDGRINAIDRGLLDSQWVAQQIGRPVIKAFNTIFAKASSKRAFYEEPQGGLLFRSLAMRPIQRQSFSGASMISASTRSTVVTSPIPGGNSRERQHTAGILTPLRCGAPTLIQAGSRTIASERRRASSGTLLRKLQEPRRVRRSMASS